LHIDPNFRMVAEKGREIPGPYHAAMALLPSGTSILQLRTQWRRGEAENALVIHLVNDRRKLAHWLRVVQADGKTLFKERISAERTLRVSLPPDTEEALPTLAILIEDEWGNEVRRQASPPLPKPKSEQAQSRGSGLVMAGAVILIGGAVAAGAGGIIAVVGGGGNLGPAFEDAAPLAMWGALVFTGAILVGAGLLGFEAIRRQSDPRPKPTQPVVEQE
jgi:hypothetical protein